MNTSHTSRRRDSLPKHHEQVTNANHIPSHTTLFTDAWDHLVGYIRLVTFLYLLPGCPVTILMYPWIDNTEWERTQAPNKVTVFIAFSMLNPSPPKRHASPILRPTNLSPGHTSVSNGSSTEQKHSAIFEKKYHTRFESRILPIRFDQSPVTFPVI